MTYDDVDHMGLSEMAVVGVDVVHRGDYNNQAQVVDKVYCRWQTYSGLYYRKAYLRVAVVVVVVAVGTEEAPAALARCQNDN